MSSADFDNFRKRAEKEKIEIIKLANEELIKKILHVFDNLERAKEASLKTQDLNALIEGIEGIIKQFATILEGEGVTPIKAIGEKFDPNLHHAVSRVETEDYPDDTIIDEMQRGYFYKSKVLRPSLVKVAKNAKEELTESEEDEE